MEVMKIKLYIKGLFFIFLLTRVDICLGQGLGTATPRYICFEDTQPGCDKEFTDAYPHMSRSYMENQRADTWFLLFPPMNADDPELLHKCGGWLPPSTAFDRTKRLCLIPMPFNAQYCGWSVFKEWTIQLHERESCNVMIIDYSWGNLNDYHGAVENMKIAANQTIQVLKNIINQLGFKPEIVVIGHSLGAQFGAYVGREIEIDFIIGLDVAGPAFGPDVPNDEKLDPSDAKFVVAIHTNSGCFPNLGVDYDVGHIDYYVNGGTVQLACYDYLKRTMAKKYYVFGLMILMLPTLCYHVQSTQYFKMSINPDNCQYIAVKCDKKNPGPEECNDCGINGENCTIMGMDIEYCNKGQNPPRGRYHVRTNNTCDYCDNSKIKGRPRDCPGAVPNTRNEL